MLYKSLKSGIHDFSGDHVCSGKGWHHVPGQPAQLDGPYSLNGLMLYNSMKSGINDFSGGEICTWPACPTWWTLFHEWTRLNRVQADPVDLVSQVDLVDLQLSGPWIILPYNLVDLIPIMDQVGGYGQGGPGVPRCAR